MKHLLRLCKESFRSACLGIEATVLWFFLTDPLLLPEWLPRCWVRPQNKCLALFLVLDVTYYWCLSAVNQCAVCLKNPIMCDYMNNQLNPCSSTTPRSPVSTEWSSAAGKLRNYQVATLGGVTSMQLGSAFCKLVDLCEIKITTKYFVLYVHNWNMFKVSNA